MEIKANVLDRQFFKYQEEYEKKALEVLRSGWYIMGKEVENFEKEFATWLGADRVVGLGSGLDALWISMNVLGITKGDEVLVQGNTYIATVMGITMNGATPIFVEPNAFHNMDDTLIESLITEKTKAILVTHLYGQATKMDKIVAICKKYNLFLVEDCAQSHGAKYNGQMTGTFGDVGCFSFYPSKNLGCFGDGGAICTNNPELAQKIKTYRNYGSQKRYYNEVIGTNSRLDELQAGLLRVKLTHIDQLAADRKMYAEMMTEKINNVYIQTPKVDKDCTTVWHLFVVTTKYREQLMNHLSENGVQSLIHYPVPPHLQQGYEYLNHKVNDFVITERLANEVLSIPLYDGITLEEVEYVINTVNKFSI